jgi:Beta-lactamase enzyme family
MAAVLAPVLVASVAIGFPASASINHGVVRHVGSDSPAPAPSVRRVQSTDCSNPSTIASCVMKILSPAGGTQGVFLQQLGGSVLASDNASSQFEPASSIKALIALFAMTQVEHGTVRLTTHIPMVSTSGGPDDCPPGTIDGTEPLGTALQEMMQVSDNNRTEELMEYFGVANLNSFAVSLGLTGTHFQTSSDSPGFNVIGCLSYGYDPLPATVDGNTMTLQDAATIWGDIASLPAPYADAIYELSAGRDMFNSQGYDFTGTWPILTTLAGQLAPSGLSSAQLASFDDRMTVSVKGGSYDVYDCTTGPSCEATWWVFAGNAEIPSCNGSSVQDNDYVWGYFVNDSVGPYNSNPDDTIGGTAFFNAEGQVLAAPIAADLAGWSSCAPTVTPTLKIKKAVLSTQKTVDIGTTLTDVTDADPTDITEDLNGTVKWGDGGSSFLTVSGGEGSFQLHGWHRYAARGTYRAQIKMVNEATGVVAKRTLTVIVS